MVNKTYEHDPNWAVCPGEMIAEYLEEKGMSQRELASRTDRPEEQVSRLISGKIQLTPEWAQQLEYTLGVPMSYWLNLQSIYDERKLRTRDAIAQHSQWVASFPIKEMKAKWSLAIPDDYAQAASWLLTWFGVSSAAALDKLWDQHYQAAFRHSPIFDSSEPCLRAWLRLGQLQALTFVKLHAIGSFSKDALINAAKEIRTHTANTNLANGWKDTQAALAKAGVVLLGTPEIAKVRLNGATHWHNNIPIIQLTLRHKREDVFWFSLFHEIAHLFLEDKNTWFVHTSTIASTSDKEVAANNWARDTLIPQANWVYFTDIGDYSPKNIVSFSKQISISPSIVAGRLLFEKRIKYSRGIHALIRKLSWGKPSAS